MRHPDRGTFELEYFQKNAGNTRFIFQASDGKTALDTIVASSAGENTFRFVNSKTLINPKQYTIKMTTPDLKEYPIVVRLR